MTRTLGQRPYTAMAVLRRRFAPSTRAALLSTCSFSVPTSWGQACVEAEAKLAGWRLSNDWSRYAHHHKAQARDALQHFPFHKSKLAEIMETTSTGCSRPRHRTRPLISHGGAEGPEAFATSARWGRWCWASAGCPSAPSSGWANCHRCVPAALLSGLQAWVLPRMPVPWERAVVPGSGSHSQCLRSINCFLRVRCLPC